MKVWVAGKGRMFKLILGHMKVIEMRMMNAMGSVKLSYQMEMNMRASIKTEKDTDLENTLL